MATARDPQQVAGQHTALPLDLADLDAVRRVVREVRPAVIVNAAAYTAVDRAETEAEQAALINSTVPGLLAEEAARCNAAIIHYSTDYVFDGAGRPPVARRRSPASLESVRPY